MLNSGEEDRVTIGMLATAAPELLPLTTDPTLENRFLIEALYEAAAADQLEEVREVQRDEALRIPNNVDYNDTSLNLSMEEREKLWAVQPQTVNSF